MVSVICPVWNQSTLTNRFLYQHWNLYKNSDVEFIIIDNGSTDNTTRLLDQWQKVMGERLKVVVNSDNRGFGPANNQGAAITTSDILVFISNDVDIYGDYLSLIKSRVDDLALYGAQLLDYDTGWNTFNGHPIPYLTGWCIMATRKVWDDLGGFDERYVPCDYEDIDLSLTATKKGYLLGEIALPLRHISGQSAAHLEGGRLAITLNSQKLFKEKWGF